MFLHLLYRLVAGAAVVLLCSATVFAVDPATEAKSKSLKIFSGEPQLLIVNGYSTSQHWWAFLQRKIDRRAGGPDNRVVEVQLCNKGGTPISGWMNVNTGERSTAWTHMLAPMIQAEKGKRNVVVLCQQSLQGVYRVKGAGGQRSRAEGIRSTNDSERIKRGAEVIKLYATNLLDDGAAGVIVAMHIYKKSMEPEIGNERLALSELMTREPARIFAGPDVWTPTSKQYPTAFDTDKRHPNFIGAEIMAHHWFKSMLEREGLDVPAWSREEMANAINDQPMGQVRDNDIFQRKLKEWKIVSRKPSAPPRDKRRRRTGSTRSG